MLYCLGLCLLTACAGPQLGALPEPAEVQNRLATRAAAVRGFELQGEIALDAPQGSMTGDHLIQGSYPDRLRAQILGPFGRPLLHLVVDGQNLMALDYQANRAYRGRASRENLRRFLGMAFSPAEVFALLAGNPPLMPAEETVVLPGEGRGEVLLNRLGPGGAVVESLVLASPDLTPLAAWLRQGGRREEGSQGLGDDGSVLLDCRFGDFTAVGAERFPRAVDFKDNRGRSFSLRNEVFLINPPLDGAIFEPLPPPGVEVVDLP